MAEPLVVVAKYKEDTSWTKDCPWKTWVITKDVEVPNVGREPATYLWAIDQLWDKLPDKLAFVQGKPLDHCPDLFEKLKQPITGFTALGHELFTTYGDGGPTHHGLPVEHKYKQWIGGWPGRVDFTRGCQFIVTAENIKKHPRAMYRKLHKEMLEGEIPWVFERLVGEIFSEKNIKQPSTEPKTG